MSKKLSKQDETIKQLENQISELKTGWQRTQADFENFRNRTQKEKQESLKSAGCDLMLKILPVIDNFELALKHKPKDLEKNTYVQGLEHIKTQLAQILVCEGLTLIEVKLGDQFNPNIHEALSSEKSDKFQEGQIIAIVENGYKFGDKVLKPVKVKVGK